MWRDLSIFSADEDKTSLLLRLYAWYMDRHSIPVYYMAVFRSVLQYSNRFLSRIIRKETVPGRVLRGVRRGGEELRGEWLVSSAECVRIPANIESVQLCISLFRIFLFISDFIQEKRYSVARACIITVLRIVFNMYLFTLHCIQPIYRR